MPSSSQKSDYAQIIFLNLLTDYNQVTVDKEAMKQLSFTANKYLYISRVKWQVAIKLEISDDEYNFHVNESKQSHGTHVLNKQ